MSVLRFAFVVGIVSLSPALYAQDMAEFIDLVDGGFPGDGPTDGGVQGPGLRDGSLFDGSGGPADFSPCTNCVGDAGNAFVDVPSRPTGAEAPFVASLDATSPAQSRGCDMAPSPRAAASRPVFALMLLVAFLMARRPGRSRRVGIRLA